jgi:hypothetical protein
MLCYFRHHDHSIRLQQEHQIIRQNRQTLRVSMRLPLVAEKQAGNKT